MEVLKVAITSWPLAAVLVTLIGASLVWRIYSTTRRDRREERVIAAERARAVVPMTGSGVRRAE